MPRDVGQGRRRDARLLTEMIDAGGRVGLVVRRGERHRPAVHAPQQTLPLERDEVLAGSVVGHPELGDDSATDSTWPFVFSDRSTNCCRRPA